MLLGGARGPRATLREGKERDIHFERLSHHLTLGLKFYRANSNSGGVFPVLVQDSEKGSSLLREKKENPDWGARRT